MSTSDRVLNYLNHYIGTHGRSPTFREIAAGCSLKSTTQVTLALNKLAREGYIVREKDTSRAIRLTNKRME